METRVYIFAGFLDSGKTSFINDTLMNPDFYSEEDTLLISFEEGEVAYNDIYLKSDNNVLGHDTSRNLEQMFYHSEDSLSLEHYILDSTELVNWEFSNHAVV